MRNVKEPLERYSDMETLKYIQEVIGKKIREIIFLHNGFGLDLSYIDTEKIYSLLNAAVEMHILLGTGLVLTSKYYIHTKYICFSITKKCYGDVEKILLEPREKIKDDSLLAQLYFVNDGKKYQLGVQYLFETDDDHYYLVGTSLD